MKKHQDNLLLLTCLFVVSLIISNVVTTRLVKTGVMIWGIEVVVPGAVFCYAITFLITDVIGEIWGKAEANRVVKYGVYSQISATALIIFTGYLPTFSFLRDAYGVILGQNALFVISSLCAYWISQTIDVRLFHWLKSKNGERHKWLRNNVSTTISQFVDTAIFISLAFGVGYGWGFEQETRGTLIVMLMAQYVLKVCLALLDMPVFYFLTRFKH